MDAPRCMKESVRSLKSSEVCAVEYCTATSSLVVVDMGASLHRDSSESVTKRVRLRVLRAQGPGGSLCAAVLHEALGDLGVAHATPEIKARL